MAACGLAIVLAATLASCGGGGTAPAADAVVRRGETLTGGGLRHRVDVTLTGDTASIRSTVENVGDASVNVVARMCGLDVDPNLPWGDEVRCAGYSQHRTLLPGELLTETDRRVVERTRTSLRVRHLIAPDTWVTVTLR